MYIHAITGAVFSDDQVDAIWRFIITMYKIGILSRNTAFDICINFKPLGL